MIKIVKNNTQYEDLKWKRFIFYTEDFGAPMYAPINLEALLAYTIAKIQK